MTNAVLMTIPYTLPESSRQLSSISTLRIRLAALLSKCFCKTLYSQRPM